MKFGVPMTSLSPFLPPLTHMPTTAKKSTTKTPSKASGAATRSHAPTHPTWVDMIKECIVDNPDDARVGVSRLMIKKFVENKYHIDLNPSTASQLNRAITSGSERGIFFLPKGPSGKVKLAPKSRSDTTKENKKPASKKSASKIVSTKAKASTENAPARKPVARTTARTPPKTKALTTTRKSKTVKPAATTTKKSTSALKKVSVKKLAATTKKAPVPKKLSSTKKKTTSKRGVAKKAVTGEAKKSKSTTAATKPASKAKAKPVSKNAKPASRIAA